MRKAIATIPMLLCETDACGQSAESIAQATQAFGQDDDITVLTLALAPAEVLHA
ncbi:MAG: hypothetical protein P4K93_08390 [Terracidiphilus sp.]|nr:hypothetical protein [Terracidiphilus sp.]MDR3798155.1 hypothetical protein [Terracidiphilus sp.]